MKNHFVLFDLDGTITDSSEGIINSIQFALEKMGITESDKDRLRTYVGPSLKQTFLTNYFPEGDDYKKAIKFYREYFAEKGIFENKLYPHITEILEELRASGVKIALATAKPTYFALIILKHFNIYQYFDVVVGSHLTGSRSDKKEIIFEVLDQLGHPDPKNTVMIGDREYDINGGKHHQLKTIGVSYGYAPDQELEDSNPTVLVNTTMSLLEQIKSI